MPEGRGFWFCWYSHHPAVEPRTRSARLLGRRASHAQDVDVSGQDARLSCVGTLVSGPRPAPDVTCPLDRVLDTREERSMPMVQHGRVFTASPALANPYTIQLERYYGSLLFGVRKSGNDACGRGLFLPVCEHRGLQAREGKVIVYTWQVGECQTR